MTIAEAISGDGETVGGQDSSGYPARWTTGTGTELLGSLPEGDEPRGAPLDVSADGGVIVGWAWDYGFLERPFRWTAATGMQRISLPSVPVNLEARAVAVSPDGRAVALRWSDGVSRDLAYLWDNERGLRRVSDILGDHGISMSDWQNFEATELTSVNGTVIGFGRDAQGKHQSWIAQLCVGDLDGDGDIGIADLSMLLSNFGKCIADPDFWPAPDLDQRGCVDLGDLTIMLSNFGSQCP